MYILYTYYNIYKESGDLTTILLLLITVWFSFPFCCFRWLLSTFSRINLNAKCWPQKQPLLCNVEQSNVCNTIDIEHYFQLPLYVPSVLHVATQWFNHSHFQIGFGSSVCNVKVSLSLLISLDFCYLLQTLMDGNECNCRQWRHYADL